MSLEVIAPKLDDPSLPRVVKTPVVDDMPYLVERYLLLAAHSETEICGIISTSWAVYPIRNMAASPVQQFLLDKKLFRESLEQICAVGEKILGIFHTHPSGHISPSARDIQGWPNRDLNWRYFIATTTEVAEFKYLNQPAKVVPR